MHVTTAEKGNSAPNRREFPVPMATVSKTLTPIGFHDVGGHPDKDS